MNIRNSHMPQKDTLKNKYIILTKIYIGPGVVEKRHIQNKRTYTLYTKQYRSLNISALLYCFYAHTNHNKKKNLALLFPSAACSSGLPSLFPVHAPSCGA